MSLIIIWEEIILNDVKLKDLYMGLPDGEVEARDKRFQELFFDPNNKYNEIINSNEKFLIIGSKGTGKTYLSKYIVEQSPSKQTCIIVDPKNFWICKLINIDEQELTNDYISVLCKWFLLYEIANSLLNKHRWLKHLPRCKLNKLRKFMLEYNDDTFYKIVSLSTTNNQEITGNLSHGISHSDKLQTSNFQHSAGIKTSDGVSYESTRKRFFDLIDYFEQLVFDCFQINDHLLIILDDLDELKKEAGEQSENIIYNLITAAKKYNFYFNSRAKSLKIIMLLRSDILNKMQGNHPNLNKIKTSCSIDLYWLLDSTHDKWDHPLISMIFHKIRASCEPYKNRSNKELFEILFPESIDKKNPLDFLLDHSLGRPRDIVTFLNCAKKEFPERTCCSATVLKETRKIYATDFYNEMLNQASFYKSSAYSTQCLKLIAGIKRPSFSYSDIQTLYEENRTSYSEIDNLDDALHFLYELGAIGNAWKSKKGKHRTCWYYKIDAIDEVDLSQNFTIYYGLRKKFSL